ncbi:MAG TPA: outer membrane beta-barrel protein, partial [Bacteroidales bacterium]|nr:outer membrane beta-barrel protein [Bacteroidales bacterium]
WISSSSIKSDDITAGDVTLESVSNAKVGYHFGLVSQIKFAGIYIQPELLFSSVGGQVRLKETTVSHVIDQRFSRIDIPVVVGKAFGPLRLGVGPVFTMVLNSSSELDDFGAYDDKFKKATIGYQLDLGLDISKIAIDLKYEGSLTKLGDGVTLGENSYNFDSRPRQFILSVGLFF